MTPIEIVDDEHAAASRGAAIIAERARAAVEERGAFLLALSGGRSPLPMFAALADESVPWDRLSIWQVDERVAPPGHEDRNLEGLLGHLPNADRLDIHPMRVELDDPEEAAAAYARELPEVFDLIHLGLGDDGHTASLVPGDPVLEVRDRDVAATGEYQGRRRVTLTYPALERAREALWHVVGGDRREALQKLLDRDPSIPASHVATPRQLIVADVAAAPLSARGDGR
jgi:6-phosphogluconolactonase